MKRLPPPNKQKPCQIHIFKKYYKYLILIDFLTTLKSFNRHNIRQVTDI